MILQSWLLLPWLIMRQNCGGLVKFFENTKTLLIIMWSKPNIHITEAASLISSGGGPTSNLAKE